MMASENQIGPMPLEQSSSAQEEQGQGGQAQDEQAQEEQAPSRRTLYPTSNAKRTTTARFARLQHRKGPTDQWKDLEQAYEAQIDQSDHPEPYNVQRVTHTILGESSEGENVSRRLLIVDRHRGEAVPRRGPSQDS